ncbi:UDP-N-acetylmuramoyl-tripeptide--D-alanyl-D-alanine ligase [Desulfosporosinus sp. BICA1-9]|uniref:UDP-N-acetylmuramoyl-tripeptide--D-alanyl-D- alanine ligase n=1 Tax=Desulfosporosinus sp. BICA1-9 TaxID=1531958 RepID=UPI00054B6E62|nr:UDP-N-acetylmuramoyl-tripeptide--D-alanyl-D-alanine ligase [Desulfosporosinus sp. BICA1-9]KJS50852.1 MAG: UDP-N-acetylmuramoyl-tripeptide--D-alanyl-D-alanine ligase [Peptococcaceae bacterium BRH_c23]KJS79392.1 MAG: UDP-N-acetylmuramoyl-tripeptide--D-alanyl-D-alanine ligase [Desulfosporosinus sp. BICA1-9]HBW36053.1 UDP-N-acetylmuramoyl-tripeptide--D-alanyl-D-alanine ligase [Desulfosporosinus sp.]
MRKWTTKEVARIVKGTLIGNPDLEVEGCIIDSRQAQGGEMFFALPGEKVDGHDYIDVVWKNGAVLVIAEEARFQALVNSPAVPEGKALLLVKSVFNTLQELARSWRRELGCKVVGVTGSNGKTTTKDMIAAVLSQRFRVHRNKENQNNELGLPITVLNAPLGTELLILEMGMRGLGEIKALCDISRPDIGVITNIGTTHLELLQTQERIAQAKWELVESLPEEGIAILNAEDLFSVKMAKNDSHLIRYYGIEGEFALPQIKGAQLNSWGALGTTFDVTFQDETAKAKLPLPGTHNVLDALAALAVGTALGVSLAEGCVGLEELELSRMRLEVRQGVGGTVLLNDVYNANPVSMKASLQVLKGRAGVNKSLAILGEMYELGTAAESGHREVGQTLAELGVSRLITVGKLAEEIAQGARMAGYLENQIKVTNTREEAIEKALDLLTLLGPGTWVLIKGSRGMKMEEITTRIERSE